jgi:hypothetical protein
MLLAIFTITMGDLPRLQIIRQVQIDFYHYHREPGAYPWKILVIHFG